MGAAAHRPACEVDVGAVVCLNPVGALPRIGTESAKLGDCRRTDPGRRCITGDAASLRIGLSPSRCSNLPTHINSSGATVSPTQASSLTGASIAADNTGVTADLRRYAPATVRNRDPILNVLRPHLPRRGLVPEVASGSDEHITHFAQATSPDLLLQPSDPDLAARSSINSWLARLGMDNVRSAIALDASSPDWPIERADAMLCINMIHISPWLAAVGLMRGTARNLAEDGMGRVRGIEQVIALAAAHCFAAPVVEAMPANNLSLLFWRDGSAGVNVR